MQYYSKSIHIYWMISQAETKYLASSNLLIDTLSTLQWTSPQQALEVEGINVPLMKFCDRYFL
jgi:hypothetical protein